MSNVLRTCCSVQALSERHSQKMLRTLERASPELEERRQWQEGQGEPPNQPEGHGDGDEWPLRPPVRQVIRKGSEGQNPARPAGGPL